MGKPNVLYIKVGRTFLGAVRVSGEDLEVVKEDLERSI
jgi:hypothetical protein